MQKSPAAARRRHPMLLEISENVRHPLVRSGNASKANDACSESSWRKLNYCQFNGQRLRYVSAKTCKASVLSAAMSWHS